MLAFHPEACEQHTICTTHRKIQTILAFESSYDNPKYRLVVIFLVLEVCSCLSNYLQQAREGEEAWDHLSEVIEGMNMKPCYI